MQLPWKKNRTHGDRLADRLTETQWDTLRAVVALAVLAGVGAGVYWGAWPVWRRWQNHRALVQAEAFGKSGDYRSMMLALQRATQLAPADLTTWQETAQLLGRINSPSILVAREQLTQLAPQDMALRLALAEDALKFGRVDTAETAIAGLDAAARQSLAFHRFAASMDASLGRNADLEKEIGAVVAADPKNLNARFTYAALRLWGTDPVARDAARGELENLLAEPAVRVRAAIELLSQASRQGNPLLVQHLLNLLLNQFAPRATHNFSRPEIPGWTALIVGIKDAAEASPADAALVARWLDALGRAPEALAWISSLAPTVRDTDIVADINAEISAKQDDLGRLGRLLRNGAWGAWPAEAQTLALAARLQDLHFSPDRGRQTWDDAVAACGDSVAGEQALARLAGLWHDPAGEEQVLRRAVQGDPKRFWAYEGLRTIYVARGDLPRLYDLYGAWAEQLPADPAIAAARIMLGCLLDRVSSDTVARAALWRRRFPDSLPSQVAYAAVLWRTRHPAEAWAVLAALPPAARGRRDVAFWVALVQADLGHAEEANAAIRAAVPGASSPEERALLQAAADEVGAKP